MERYSKNIEDIKPGQLEVHYSNGIASPRDKTNATTHGEFDNDPATMNAVLRNILGEAPPVPFTEESLRY